VTGGAPPPNPDDYVFTFVVEEELGLQPTGLRKLRELARQLPFETSMLEVARLQARVESVLNNPAGHMRLAEDFYSERPDLLEGFGRELAGQTNRTIFSPQALTFLARVLIEDATDEQHRELSPQERRRLQDAVLGAHSALETDLDRLPLPTPENKLAYELQAAIFFRRPLLLEEMTRARELLRLATDSRLAGEADLVPIGDWLSESGLSANEQWRLGFGLVAFTDAFGAAAQPRVTREKLQDLLARLRLERLSIALPAIASSRAEFRERFAALGGGEETFAWELVPFKETPFLRLESGDLVLISPPFLLSWVGEGFHYRTLTYAQNHEGGADSGKYTRFAGKIAERYALDLAEAAMPGPHVRVFGEQKYGRGGGQSTSDVAIVIGEEDLLVFEVHARRVPADVAVTGDAASVEVSRLLVTKVDQLGVAVAAFLAEDATLPGVDLSKIKRIWPFVVLATYVRQSPYLWGYLRRKIDRTKTASLKASRVLPVQLLDIEAYEKLMALLAAGEDLPRALVRKIRAQYRERDLAVWMALDPEAPSPAVRLQVLDRRWNEMAGEVAEIARLADEASKGGE
jgi:hypothetical protein